jgi:hypothetical protein
MSSRAIVNGNNETMRDFLQDLKERNREERVRHYQNERKQEREKRWYRLRGSTVFFSIFNDAKWA